MTYQITKRFFISSEKDNWNYTFATDEYETVSVTYIEDVRDLTSNSATIDIPKDCISQFISVLEQLK